MASVNKRQNPISPSDLKKSIIDANNKLEKKNDAISSRIKDAEKLVKSKEKELKDFDKQLKAKLNEIDASEKYVTKVRANIYSLGKESSKLNEVIKRLKGDESSLSKNVKKFEDAKGELKDSISSLELRRQRADKVVKDIGNIETRQSVAQADLNKLFKTQEIAKKEIENALRMGFRQGIQNIMANGRIAISTVEYWEQFGVHPMVGEKLTKDYLESVALEIKENKLPSVVSMHKFLDQMVETFKDEHKYSLTRIGVDAIINHQYAYKKKK